MMRKLFICLLVVTGCCGAYSQANWNNSSFVHRSGQQILDGAGAPLRLDGVNLGGWLMWEGWIWGGGYTQEKTIYNEIKSIVGTAAADAFRDSVYQNFIRREDIQAVSSECYNVVRIPFNHSLLEDDFNPYVYKPEGWAILDSVLEWCEDYNVYAILDLHSAPGGQSNGFTADPDLFINLWNGTINQNRTRRLWKAIADRYKDRGIIAAYDLLNEPNTGTDSLLTNLYSEIIDSIRSVDNNHMLMIEGNSLATDFSMFNDLPDPNSAFQFHFYTWFFSSSVPSHLAQYTALSDSLNAPFWCGEWGENNFAQLGSTRALFDDPAYKIPGQAFWTWKKMKDFNTYAAYNGIDSSSLWLKTIKWVSNNSNPQPTVAEMQAGIDEFIINMKYANCTKNDTVSDLLSRCITGQDEISEKKSFELYPNPASSVIQIKAKDEQVLSVEVTDLSGRSILHTDASKTETVTLDISGIQPGLYLLRVDTVKGRFSEKIEILR